MISTRDLSVLPDIDSLAALHQSLAVLDAILCPEWEFRYFSFNDRWEGDEKLGWMRNGEGDDWLALFNGQGAILKGYAHDCPMAQESPWPGVLDSVPEAFGSFLSEPAFSGSATTFCVWRLYEDGTWQVGDVTFPAGDDPDGSERLLTFLDGDPRTYKRWSDEYFGRSVDAEAIERIYRREPLSRGLAQALNPEVDYRELVGEVGEIGYPRS